MLLSGKVLGHDAQHVDVAVNTIRLQTVATKYMQSVSLLVQIDIFFAKLLGDIYHPTVDSFRKLPDGIFLGQTRNIIIIIGLIEYILKDSVLILAHFRAAITADSGVRCLKPLEVFVW